MSERVRVAVAALVTLFLNLTYGVARADCKLLEIAEFHADISSGTPILTGAINGQPIKILIDSGSEASMVMRRSADRLGLVQTKLVGQHMYGLGGNTDVSATMIKQLKVDKFVTANLDLRVAGDRDSIQPFDLILGDDFLSQDDVEFDLANGFIRLFKPQGCQPAQLVYWGQPYAQAPLLPSAEHQPTIQAFVELNGHKVLASLDSGASESTVDTTVAESLGVSRSSPGAAGAGSIRGLGPRLDESWAATFDSFALGDEKIGHPRLHVTRMLNQFQETETGSRIQQRFDNAPAMLIGADFLRAHRVFVANQEHLLLFSYGGGPVFLSAEDLAKIEYDKAISLNPNDAEAYRKRGEMRRRSGQTDLALQDFDKAVSLEPGSAVALLERGAAHHQNGDLDLAEKDLSEAIRLNPKGPDAYEIRGILYTDRHEFALAVQDFDQAVRLNPSDADAWNGRCWARAVANTELNNALADCNAALALAPHAAGILDSRAFVYFRLSQFDKTVADEDAALGIDPKQAASLFTRGLAKRRLGDVAGGGGDIAKAQAIDPKVADTYARLGVTP
jgi:tetratricopeptide (TPR) repeat protein